MFAVSRWLLALTGIAAATAAIEPALAPPALAQDSPHRQAFERCKAIDDDRLRLSCLRSILQDNEAKDRDPGKRWRLVKTTDTEGGRKAVSIMQTADTGKSDPDLAGLMIRCGGNAGDDKTGFEVLVVLMNALPLRDRPNVRVKSASGESRFTASVAVPGPLVLLPPEATALANGSWQNLSEVSIEVEDAGRTIHGVVALADLRSALSSLSASCLRDSGPPQ